MSDTLRAAAQQALEALEYHVEQTRPIHKTSEAITALRAALAATVAEPVAWAEQIIDDLTALHDSELIREVDSGDALIRLDAAIAAVEEARDRHAAPPQREPYDQTALGLCNACGWKAVGPDGCLNCAPQREREPLTDEQARTHCTLWPGSTDAARKAWLIGFRAAERAHGISAPASAPKEQG